ncbi:hypothetical protein [Bradyrhizobium brasilense]|uniref:hypothetical protein n=1 Tax=Bradyrhizobium brasilense TaxID=1419277 RepID=UPI0030B8795B
MTQVYFHCSNPTKVFLDYHGAVVDDIAEARHHATHVIRSLTEACGVKTGVTGSCTLATIRAMSCSSFPSIPSSKPQ